MNPWFFGLQIGFVLSLFIGPVFIALFESALDRGFKGGYSTSLGIWIADFFYAASFFFVFRSWEIHFAEEDIISYLALPGSIGLLSIGLFSIIKASSSHPHQFQNPEEKAISLGKCFVKGVLINAISPTTVVLWASIVGSMTALGFSVSDFFKFFGSFLVVLIVMDTIKIFLAHKLGTHLSGFHLIRLKRIAGIALIVFGLVIFVRFVL